MNIDIEDIASLAIVLLLLFLAAVAVGLGLRIGFGGPLVSVDAGFTLSHSNFVSPADGGPALIVTPRGDGHE